jgi:hypothetical protein
MRYIIMAALLVASLVHLVPLVGVLGVERLKGLYGVDVEGRDMAILMRHRAVLFGLLGAFFLAAAFMPLLQLPALLLATGSIGAFLFLGTAIGGYNRAMARLVTVDKFVIVLLLAGLGAWFDLARGAQA